MGQADQTYWAGLHDFLQGEVHPVVAIDKVTVQRLAVLELDEHGVPLGGVQ